MRQFILIYLLILLLAFPFASIAQDNKIAVTVTTNGIAAPHATVILEPAGIVSVTDSNGKYLFKGIPAGQYLLRTSSVGSLAKIMKISVHEGDSLFYDIELSPFSNDMDAVVVSGTMKAVKRMESMVPVEVYNQKFFKKNPTPNIFDALQHINGVRPQLNCNVCNTGDIHINGLEGPYTMVLIDGMPIVSSLSTVYGLSGIPHCLIERIEVVKGPASSLYGSEAVGGLINIITKDPGEVQHLSADVFLTSWNEFNADLGLSYKPGKKITALTGMNFFYYGDPKDINNDMFTDVTLQKRASVFTKFNFKRKDQRLFNVAARYFYEDRWGGDMRWNKSYRGGNEIYGESIYTKRWEWLGAYQLPMKEKVLLRFSYNDHHQDSRYGITSFIASQKTAFSQITWDKTSGTHDLLAGFTLRYSRYDDNTPATSDPYTLQTKPEKVLLPGVFIQDEIAIVSRHKILLGMRYDHHSLHGKIFTPRAAYKWQLDQNTIFRINAGSGFRVVNIFTEDHAALTGARSVEVSEGLKPEKSFNVNLNMLKKIYSGNGDHYGVDVSVWKTHFNNRILADYETDPNKIFYANLEGYAVSKGISLNIDAVLINGLTLTGGVTFQDVYSITAGQKELQMLTEKFSGTWALSYKLKHPALLIDYTGNVYGPMRLPLLGDGDPRKPYSPAWSIQNIQLTFSGLNRLEIYGGIKNLLDFLPARGNPFIIARSHDPFDKEVEYDGSGNVLRTPANPYGLTFDPTYVYAPNQGRRVFIGCRWRLNFFEPRRP